MAVVHAQCLWRRSPPPVRTAVRTAARRIVPPLRLPSAGAGPGSARITTQGQDHYAGTGTSRVTWPRAPEASMATSGDHLTDAIDPRTHVRRRRLGRMSRRTAV